MRQSDSKLAGAVRVAKVLMNGKHRIATGFGDKSSEGVADLVERESGLRALLEAASEVKELFTDLADGSRTATKERFIKVNAQLCRAINNVR